MAVYRPPKPPPKMHTRGRPLLSAVVLAAATEPVAPAAAEKQGAHMFSKTLQPGGLAQPLLTLAECTYACLHGALANLAATEPFVRPVQRSDAGQGGNSRRSAQ